MPCPPYPLALFSLRPYYGNKRAKHTVAYLDNSHYALILSNSIEALNVGFYIRGKSSITLTTLGQGVKANIYMEGSSIIKV
jgi:hypothetical protein